MNHQSKSPTDRHTDRQTDRQTDRETDRQRDRQRDRHTDLVPTVDLWCNPEDGVIAIDDKIIVYVHTNSVIRSV